jgi:hypothetical protein
MSARAQCGDIAREGHFGREGDQIFLLDEAAE